LSLLRTRNENPYKGLYRRPLLKMTKRAVAHQPFLQSSALLQMSNNALREKAYMRSAYREYEPLGGKARWKERPK
jgi:hypothetical protein